MIERFSYSFTARSAEAPSPDQAKATVAERLGIDLSRFVLQNWSTDMVAAGIWETRMECALVVDMEPLP